MSMIQINNLTFGYETFFENIFENASFQIDTDWKLGFIGRNGRGKTTFLKLLMGEFSYSGSISASTNFDYFPFEIEDGEKEVMEVVRNLIAPFTKWEAEMESCAKEGSPEAMEHYGEVFEAYTRQDGFMIDELIKIEIGKLGVSPSVLGRRFSSLSGGEKVKLMISAMFLKKNNFLLIDEPTNHLDYEGRKTMADYLRGKKGFILVSHDREFIDGVVDHVLSINKNNIEVQKGNFSTWYENKRLQDEFELGKNERLKKDIKRLTVASRRAANWSDKVEKSKHEPLSSGLSPDRGAIGHKAAKMMKRAKSIQSRQEKAIEEKGTLLKNVEEVESLGLKNLKHEKNALMILEDITISYGDNVVVREKSLIIEAGDRIALEGKNGSGKSSIMKLLMGEEICYKGSFRRASELIISYIPQDTSFLKGSLSDFAKNEGLDESLFKAILRKLDFSRLQFKKNVEEFSEGQKKKVLIAKSLITPAHLYVWDEPLNFVDVISRTQIEEMILKEQPTMLFVEHDKIFSHKVATKHLVL